jgi:hypothetical protein
MAIPCLTSRPTAKSLSLIVPIVPFLLGACSADVTLPRDQLPAELRAISGDQQRGTVSSPLAAGVVMAGPVTMGAVTGAAGMITDMAGTVMVMGRTNDPWPDAVRNHSVGGETIVVSRGWNRRSAIRTGRSNAVRGLVDWTSCVGRIVRLRQRSPGRVGAGAVSRTRSHPACRTPRGDRGISRGACPRSAPFVHVPPRSSEPQAHSRPQDSSSLPGRSDPGAGDHRRPRCHETDQWTNGSSRPAGARNWARAGTGGDHYDHPGLVGALYRAGGGDRGSGAARRRRDIHRRRPRRHLPAARRRKGLSSHYLSIGVAAALLF